MDEVSRGSIVHAEAGGLKETVVALDGPGKYYVLDTCTGADVVNDQITIV